MGVLNSTFCNPSSQRSEPAPIINHKMNLVVLGGYDAAYETYSFATLEKTCDVSNEFVHLNRRREKHVDGDNILLVPQCFATSEKADELCDNVLVKVAIDRGIAILFEKPSVESLTKLTGIGTEDAGAVVYVKSKDHRLLRMIDKPSCDIYESFCGGDAETDGEFPLARVDDGLKIEESYIKSRTLLTQITEDLLPIDTDEMEKKMVELNGNPFQSDSRSVSIPPNRTYECTLEHYNHNEWKKKILNDPSGEQKKQQEVKFITVCTLKLVAKGTKSNGKKVVHVSMAGAGFYSGVPLRNDSKHRGYFTTRIGSVFTPDNTFGNVLNYFPQNSNGEETVTHGHSWNVGFEAGGGTSGTEGKVSFGISENSSRTRNIKHFRALTEPGETNGMKFYTDINLVEGVEIDGKKMWERDTEYHEMFKFIKTALGIPVYVKKFPKLATELIPGECECVWQADGTQTGIGKLYHEEIHGVSYVYVKDGRYGFENIKYGRARPFNINFDMVDYNDP